MYKCVYEKRTYLYARTCSNMDILSYSWLFRILLLFIFITIHLPKMDLDREAHASKAFLFRNGHFILCGRLQEYHLFRRPVSDLGGLWGSRSTESGRFERNLTIQCILKGGRVALPRNPAVLSSTLPSALCTAIAIRWIMPNRSRTAKLSVSLKIPSRPTFLQVQHL